MLQDMALAEMNAFGQEQSPSHQKSLGRVKKPPLRTMIVYSASSN
jgi:hypothetical protein